MQPKDKMNNLDCTGLVILCCCYISRCEFQKMQWGFSLDFYFSEILMFPEIFDQHLQYVTQCMTF